MFVVVSFAVPASVGAGSAADGQAGGAAGPCPSGSVSVQVDAASLADGGGDVPGSCIPPGAFYEVRLTGHRLVLGMALRGDGVEGRVAFAVLTTPGELAASLVGIEDAAAGTVRWAYAEGRHSTGPYATEFAGDGVTDLPDEAAHVDVTVHGSGVDLMTARGEVADELRAVLHEALAHLAG